MRADTAHCKCDAAVQRRVACLSQGLRSAQVRHAARIADGVHGVNVPGETGRVEQSKATPGWALPDPRSVIVFEFQGLGLNLRREALVGGCGRLHAGSRVRLRARWSRDSSGRYWMTLLHHRFRRARSRLQTKPVAGAM